MKIHRFYYPNTINYSIITLNEKDSHHIVNVLRLKKHDLISIFNESGEWLSEIIESHKNKTKVSIVKQIQSEIVVDKWIHLVYAPLKNTATSFLITKATELGVNEITQVVTELTTSKPLLVEKVILKTKEAAQQCKRLSIPKVNSTKSLKSFISNLKENLLWLNEKQVGTNYFNAIKNTYYNKFTILIGPEAGFNKNEHNLLKSSKHTSSVYLKGNILKAETAGIIAIGSINYLDLF